MSGAFVAGAIAGYAIAIPVGAIAVLIIETGIRRGFRIAAAAGAGAATADFVYATLAMVGGSALAPVLAPISVPFRIAAIVALLFLGGRGLLRLWRDRPESQERRAPVAEAADAVPPGARPSADAGATGTYARYLGLTLLNPATVVYFAALALAIPSLDAEPLARPAFVLGALLASLSWQTLLAGIGAIAHHRLPPRFQAGISLLGNLVICGFAVTLARSLLPGS